MKDLILMIESASAISSVAICSTDASTLVFRAGADKSHSEVMMDMVDQLMKEHGIQFRDLSAVAVSAGPGSYTGLRIGISLAKGLCYSLDLPLIAISTLEVLTAGFIVNNPDFKGLLCPMLDARRMEVYTALFDANMQRIQPDRPLIVDEDSWKEFPSDNNIAFFGNGAAKCIGLLEKNIQAEFCLEAQLSAANMHKAAIRKYQTKQFEDIAYFEPFYLKPYQGKINPKMNRV